jgi:hypothetical protein
MFCLVLITSVASGQQPSTTAPSKNIPTAAETELPYNQQPINYSQAAPTDPVVQLKSRLESGEIALKAEGESGVLRDLLRVLKIPESSQLLVFSKSSANARFIQPKTPRAIYFNDDVYVGWVPGSKAIEISAVDKSLGGTFYNLTPIDADKPKIQREESCLLCHLSRNSLRVPGHLVRSFTTDSLGEMRTGWSRVTHETSYDRRWAGWYVTGQAEKLKHLGNVFGKSTPEPSDNTAAAVPSTCQSEHYLATTSDILPHLILNHQAHGHNLIARLNYEVRLQKPITALEPLVRYLLFLDEPPLPAPITAKGNYREWFEQQGPRDEQGRSLRDLDLNTRLFKYRLSYLIYSPAFQSLPEETRTEIDGHIKAELTQTTSPIPAAERAAILEIFEATARGS